MSDDDNEDRDLTRIEDLAEFLHDEEEDDNLFGQDEENEAQESLPSLDDLESDENFGDEAEEFSGSPTFETASQDEAELAEDMEASEEAVSFGAEGEFSSEESAFGDDEFASADEFSSADEFGATEEFGASEEFGSETDLTDDTFAQDQDEEDFSFNSENEIEEAEAEADFQDDQAPLESEEVEEIEEEPVAVAPPISSYDEKSETPPATTPIQNFDDLKQFAESISYGAVAQGGNPPFSIVLRRIRYQEDAEDIMIVLRDHGLVTPENEKSLEQSLSNGSLLISQISEYSAIYLAHRFRRFDLEIMVGLSDEIHPSHSYDADARGLVSKENIRQNVHESFDLERTPIKIDRIILTTTPTLEGYTIREYLGVISHHSVLSAQEIEEFSPSTTPSGDDVIDAIQKDIHAALDAARDDEEVQPFGQGLETIYKEMANALRAHALKMGANAVVGINYQLTPVLRAAASNSEVQYKVTCLGSAVWAVGD